MKFNKFPTKMKIRFLLPQLSQPRCIKRILCIEAEGYDVDVYGINNGLYTQNIKDLGDVTTHSFNLTAGVPRKKSLQTKARCVKALINSLEKNDVVYIFGIELALIFWLYAIFKRKIRYVYEQADLNYTKLGNKFLRGLFKKIDKWLIRKSEFTVLTSKGFTKYLYDGRDYEKIVLLPNKLSRKINVSDRLNFDNKAVDTNHIKFGFIGAIRYPSTIFTFARVVGEHFPDDEFHFYGNGIFAKEAEELCSHYANLFYHGSFSNPDDLAKIYGSVDVNVVCYDTKSYNVCIAEPNKLYESIFFNTPIVVSSGTYLSERVAELGVGNAIDSTNYAEIKQYINSLTDDKVCHIIDTMKKIDTKALFDDESELLQRLQKLAN